MIFLIEDNKEHQYQIYRSDTIIKYQKEILRSLDHSHQVLMKNYSNLGESSTWLYSTYNIFSLVGESKVFFDLFKDLRDVIRLNASEKNQIWMQCWLNRHKSNEVLDWHTHTWCRHGYISIDPKKTKTVFRNYEIKNQPGNIYIGPGYREHKVEILHPYDDERITLGFDVSLVEAPPNGLMSLIPVT